MRPKQQLLILCIGQGSTVLDARLKSLTNFSNHYLRQGKQSEHWRRLWDWSFCLCVCPSLCLFVCLCTRWLIIISTCHTQPAGTVAPSCENFHIGGDMHSHKCLLVVSVIILHITMMNILLIKLEEDASHSVSLCSISPLFRVRQFTQ